MDHHDQIAHNKIATVDNLSMIQALFEQIIKKCHRSSTKKNLHSNKKKNLCLSVLLAQVDDEYGDKIISSFQQEYERNQLGLSFLFSQVVNAVLQSAFCKGSCHGQAAYSLFELFKIDVFNATLAKNNTEKSEEQHVYLIIPDKNELNKLTRMDTPCTLYSCQNAKPAFENETLFFDSWSKELRTWKEFSSTQLWKKFSFQNECTKAMRTRNPMVFKPLILFFDNDKILFLEKILWCLSEYHSRLQEISVNLHTLSALPQTRNIISGFDFQEIDSEFEKEVALLTNKEECLVVLKKHIQQYQNDFTQQLEIEYRTQYEANQFDPPKTSQQKSLYLSTCLFFHDQSKQKLWKPYPSKNLKGRFLGHDVFFLNMPGEGEAAAKDFSKELKQEGFDATVSRHSKGASILVDLTNSVRP